MANIFMLVHAVLPHAHHDGIICFSLEELAHQNHCSDQHHGLDCCTHSESKNHHHETSENCDLKDVVMRQADTHDEIVPCADCLSLLYTFYTLNEFYLEEPQFGERFRQKPYSETYLPPFVGTISSLRAPPSYFLG